MFNKHDLDSEEFDEHVMREVEKRLKASQTLPSMTSVRGALLFQRAIVLGSKSLDALKLWYAELEPGQKRLLVETIKDTVTNLQTFLDYLAEEDVGR